MKSAANETMLYLAERVRALVGDDPRITEKNMFGGLTFLLDGHILIGCKKDGRILVSVGKAYHEEAAARPGAVAMIHNDRVMSGFFWVDGDAIEDDADLDAWIAFARRAVSMRPAKDSKPAKKVAAKKAQATKLVRLKRLTWPAPAMFEISRAQPQDVPAAIAALGDAFAHDPMMHYFFSSSPTGIRTSAMEFFSILLRARIALDMPAYVLRQGNNVLGVVMGYDISRPTWPAELTEEWRRLEERVPGLADRLAAYETISESYEPKEAHYYLGVIGVHPSLQGKGAGKALIDTFCAISAGDAKSHGVYLETGSTDSLRFYINNGFELRGEGSLDGTPMWCVFKPS
jgi:GNAT superfamily N-acetyltransferase